jgi:uncharacterized protein
MFISINMPRPTAQIKKSNPPEERLGGLIQSMHDTSTNYSIVLSSYRVDEDRPSTSQIISATRKFDNQIGIVAGFTLDNHTCEDLRRCRRWLIEGIIKGIKLYCGYEHHYPYDERYQRIYDMCDLLMFKNAKSVFRLELILASSASLIKLRLPLDN